MLTLILQNSKLRQRSLNLILQLLLVAIIFILHNNDLISSLPLAFLLSNAVHYSLIALADIYEDDDPNNKNKYLVQLGLLSYFVAGLFFGLFENEYIRLHAFIVLLGNWFGGKVDTTMWKLMFCVYLGTIFGYEFGPALLSAEGLNLATYNYSLLIYSAFAVSIICVCERLSEKNQQAWMVHSILFFIWALIQGPFYQEGILFLMGGLAYESTKVMAGFITTTTPKSTSSNTSSLQLSQTL